MQQPADNQSIKIIADLIHERTGLRFEDGRLDLLADKLLPLVAERNFSSLLDYYYYLRYGESAEREWMRIQSVLAVNESYFWREVNAIRAAAEIIIPRLQRERPGRPVRIWHAASATGEEPYTMAIILDQMGAFLRGEIEILATDFNQEALERAQTGIFRPRSFRQIPPEIQTAYFRPAEPGKLQIRDEVMSRVKFVYLNLLDKSSMSLMAGFDVIFCRNVFIYFSTSAIQQVITQFYQTLSPSGYLFVAAAESLLRWSDMYRLVDIGSTIAYQKVTIPERVDQGKGSEHR